MKKLLRILLIVFGGLVLIGTLAQYTGPSNPGYVKSTPVKRSTAPNFAFLKASDYGDDWPFTVERGELECRRGALVTFFANNGVTYGLNGTAQAAGYPSIDPIWKNNPKIPGTKISVGYILQRGLDLC